MDDYFFVLDRYFCFFYYFFFFVFFSVFFFLLVSLCWIFLILGLGGNNFGLMLCLLRIFCIVLLLVMCLLEIFGWFFRFLFIILWCVSLAVKFFVLIVRVGRKFVKGWLVGIFRCCFIFVVLLLLNRVWLFWVWMMVKFCLLILCLYSIFESFFLVCDNFFCVFICLIFSSCCLIIFCLWVCMVKYVCVNVICDFDELLFCVIR